MPRPPVIGSEEKLCDGGRRRHRPSILGRGPQLVTSFLEILSITSNRRLRSIASSTFVDDGGITPAISAHVQWRLRSVGPYFVAARLLCGGPIRCCACRSSMSEQHERYLTVRPNQRRWQAHICFNRPLPYRWRRRRRWRWAGRLSQAICEGAWNGETKECGRDC